MTMTSQYCTITIDGPWTKDDLEDVNQIMELFRRRLLFAGLFHDGGLPSDIAAGVTINSVLAKAFQW